jgi:hypothetical protein
MASPWTPLTENEMVIAHLSDLHFGSGDSVKVWQSVKNVFD